MILIFEQRLVIISSASGFIALCITACIPEGQRSVCPSPEMGLN